MHRSKKKRNIVIFSLIGVLLCMVVGYAAFQTRLEISGSSTVTGNWDIEITNVNDGEASGTAENATKPSWTNLTASIEANLYDKGDAMEYDVTIENKGTIDAKLNDILTNLEQENSDAVIITFSGYAKGEILKAGSIKLIHVKIEYNPDYEGEETSSEVTIDFDYTQNNNETSPSEKMHLVNYDCTTNGGTSCTNYNEYLLEGSNINLTHKGSEKKYYNFVGWNTNKDATTALTTLTMGVGDITLYAIYEEVDPSEPIIDNISTAVATNSITVVVSAHDDESGIVKYEYSIDGGKTWIDRGSNNTYTFTGLTSDSLYQIDIRVTNGVEKAASSNKQATTTTLLKPTFSEEGTTNKTVTITYPSGCGNTLTCTYQKDNGSSVNVTSTTAKVTFTDDGNVVAAVTDGTNSVSSSYTVQVERTLNIGTVKGGSITLDKESALLSEDVNITTSPTTDFTYQGATLVCEDGSTKEITGTEFNMSECNSKITVYPTWKKNELILFNDTASVSFQHLNWNGNLFDGYTMSIDMSANTYILFSSPSSFNARAQVTSTAPLDITDYDTFRVGVACFKGTRDTTVFFGPVEDRTTWVHDTGITMSVPHEGGNIGNIDISNFNNNYYLAVEILTNDQIDDCYFNGAVLLGTTYSYTNRGI